MRNLNYMLHGLLWLLYSGACYGYNVISHPHTRYVQIVAALPLLILAFYSGYALAARLGRRGKRESTLLIFVLLCMCSMALAYGWVQYLMPYLSIQIPYYPLESVAHFVQEVLSIFLRYTAYGVAFYAIKHSDTVRRLKVKILTMQVLPHALYNIWAHICGILAPIPAHVQEQIQSFMGLQAYGVRIPDLPEDLVWADLELAKLRSWLATAEEDIRIEVRGEPFGHRVQPFSLITLVDNARKHHKPNTPIKVSIGFDEAVIRIHCQNQIDEQHGQRPGLKTGLQNLRDRLTLQPQVSATLSIDILDNHYIATLIYKKPKNQFYDEKDHNRFIG